MKDCLFCKILKGEIPSQKVYEDEIVFAFRDISPAAPCHVLIISKEHIASAAEIGEENAGIVGRIFAAAARIAAAEGLSDGFRVVTNVGERAGQTVSHLHFHLLGGRDMTWPPG